MPLLPSGTVTFLLTDIEGSTRLWTERPDAMKAAVERHDALLAAGIEANGGALIKSRLEGDSIFAVFARTTDAVAAAVALQQALLAEAWTTSRPLRVRMALHTGEADLRDGDYYGPSVNRCARLRAIAHGGQVLLSLAAEELVRDHLPPGASVLDLGLHRLQDLARPEHVFQLAHPELMDGFPALRSLEAFPNNLPVQLTSFIGREHEMEAVRRLVRSSRLLTLTGMGGSGKTRLALQVGADILGDYPDGVWLVELAGLTDPALVPQAVASALGVREEAHRPVLPTLAEYLRQKQLLLILDNCEHLVDAAAQLADTLVRASSTLQILATSREALGIGGESTWAIPSLSLPSLPAPPRAGTAPTLPDPHAAEALSQYEAVRLFVDRAVAVSPAFAVTNENAPAVAQVCHRLDGIPLAIELAAARVKVLSVEQIADRLDDRFRLLTGGSRTALPRQQTLRALIDWSYDLLTPPERALLRRLSAFAGGWTLEAAEQVCAGEAGDGPELDSYEVLDLLAQLVDKSLVLVDEGSGHEVRYDMLETVRQYSRDRLQEAGETAAVRANHLAFYLGLAERVEPELQRPRQALWLDQLEVEHENLRTALEWSLTHAEGAESGLRLASALWWFWFVHGHYHEGRRWLEETLRHGAALPPLLRGRALTRAGLIASRQGDLQNAEALALRGLEVALEAGDPAGRVAGLLGLAMLASRRKELSRAQAWAEEALDLCRADTSRWGMATSLMLLAQIHSFRMEHARAEALIDEGLALFHSLGDRWGVATLLLNRSYRLAIFERDHDAAIAMFDECLMIFRELGDRGGLAEALFGKGLEARLRGDYTAARPLLEEACAIGRQVGLQVGLAMALSNLGLVLRKQGALAAARACYDESLAMRREQGDTWSVSFSLLGLAQVLAEQGDLPAARAACAEATRTFQPSGDAFGLLETLEAWATIAGCAQRWDVSLRLWAASQANRRTARLPRLPACLETDEPLIAAARAALGEEPAQIAWTKGEALSLAEALELALREA